MITAMVLKSPGHDKPSLRRTARTGIGGKSQRNPSCRPLPRAGRLKINTMKRLTVELSTPAGPVFSASASSIDLRTGEGSLHFSSGEETYLNMIQATEIICRTADGTHVFGLTNAVAGLRGSRFTVLAEHIRRIEHSAEFPINPVL